MDRVVTSVLVVLAQTELAHLRMQLAVDLICEDHQVDELVGIIARTARTGQAEAGWIFVIDVVRAIPVGAM